MPKLIVDQVLEGIRLHSKMQNNAAEARVQTREVVLLVNQKEQRSLRYKHSLTGKVGVKYSNKGATRTIYFQSPSWYQETTWEVLLHRCLTGWQINLRQHRVQPNDALIFQSIRNGDIPEIKRLFATGLASPFDRDGYGDTLLAVSGPSCSSLWSGRPKY